LEDKRVSPIENSGVTALATASAAPMNITRPNTDAKDTSIARRISCCLPRLERLKAELKSRSATLAFEDVVLDTPQQQGDFESEHQPIGICA
jgi:hypothetical protein